MLSLYALAAPTASTEALRILALETEFEDLFGRWIRACYEFDWSTVQGEGFDCAPGEDMQGTTPLRKLLKAPVGEALKKLAEQGLGKLTRMATHSPVSIGAVLSQSFCERVNSCANLLLTLANTVLNDEELGILVVLRMNAELFSMLRTLYKDVPDTVKHAEMAAMEKMYEIPTVR